MRLRHQKLRGHILHKVGARNMSVNLAVSGIKIPRAMRNFPKNILAGQQDLQPRVVLFFANNGRRRAAPARPVCARVVKKNPAPEKITAALIQFPPADRFITMARARVTCAHADKFACEHH